MVIDIRTRGFTLTPGLRTHLERRLDFALDRHQERVAPVRAVIGEANGRRGGREKVCRITLELRGGRPVRATVTSGDAYSAIDAAAHRVARALTRAVERERAATLELLWLARTLSRSDAA